MKLGLAFICGTETQQIRDMLDSVKSVNFDCISVVMTKDNSETKKILEEYGCKISRELGDGKLWNDDFSNWDFAYARQLSYDNCDADWIIYLDTDDILTNPEKLRELVEKADKGYDAITLPYDYEPNNVYSKERVVRKGKYNWRGLVHEALIPTKDVKWVNSNDVIVTHKAVPNNRNERNLYLIEKEYQESKTSRTVFYCGKDSLFMGKNKEAIKYFKEFLTMESSKEEKYSALMFMCRADYENTLEYCKQAIELLADYPEPYFKMARWYFDKKDYINCVQLSKLGFSKKLDAPFGMPINRLELTQWPIEVMNEAVSKLKSMAYDLISIIESSRKDLNIINQVISYLIETNKNPKNI